MWMGCEPRWPRIILVYIRRREAQQTAAERDPEHAIGRTPKARTLPYPHVAMPNMRSAGRLRPVICFRYAG